jgi:hypothetical protein
MNDAPHSISDLVARWDTIGDFADAISCGYEAARQMRRRESIAPEHWPKVIEAAKARGIPGVTIDWLVEQRVAA